MGRWFGITLYDETGKCADYRDPASYNIGDLIDKKDTVPEIA